MSTATSTTHWPSGTQTHSVTMELVPAIAEDLKEFDYWDEIAGVRIKKMKLRLGLIFWLYSHVKLEIEQTPYVISEHTDPNELKEWLDAEMIFLAKNPFNDE